MAKFTRGFTGRGKAARDPRLPPGQYDAGDQWPICGALLVNLRNILEALDVVADAQPVEVPGPSALSTT